MNAAFDRPTAVADEGFRQSRLHATADVKLDSATAEGEWGMVSGWRCLTRQRCAPPKVKDSPHH